MGIYLMIVAPFALGRIVATGLVFLGGLLLRDLSFGALVEIFGRFHAFAESQDVVDGAGERIEIVFVHLVDPGLG